MRLISFAAIAFGLACSGCTAPDGKPAAYSAMFSADEALKVLFDDVCIPAILEDKPVEQLAEGRAMIEVKSRGVNAGAGDHEWRLATLGNGSVTAWADGTCMVSVDLGDPEKHSAYLLSAMAARGVPMTKGQTTSANGVVSAAYCAAGPLPVMLAIKTAAPGGAKRAAVVASLNRAKRTRPDLCNAS